jgi:hypothetical protein
MSEVSGRRLQKSIRKEKGESMPRTRNRCLAATVVSAIALGAVVLISPTAASAPRGPAGTEAVAAVAAVATMTTRDFRVAVVARRLDGGGTPTAEVRVGLARRVGGSWRELGERRLGETYFWNTVTGPRGVCRLAVASAGSSSTFRPSVMVQLLLSPSLGCGRAHRIALPRR